MVQRAVLLFKKANSAEGNVFPQYGVNQGNITRGAARSRTVYNVND